MLRYISSLRLHRIYCELYPFFAFLNGSRARASLQEKVTLATMLVCPDDRKPRCGTISLHDAHLECVM